MLPWYDFRCIIMIFSALKKPWNSPCKVTINHMIINTMVDQLYFLIIFWFKEMHFILLGLIFIFIFIFPIPFFYNIGFQRMGQKWMELMEKIIARGKKKFVDHMKTTKARCWSSTALFSWIITNFLDPSRSKRQDLSPIQAQKKIFYVFYFLFETKPL